jgi:hypothetical protein
MEPEDAAAQVRRFLRAQNLEQLGKIDEAIALYEDVIATEFDSSGPYDRLIALYGDRSLHGDVVRIAEAALQSVQTYQEKRAWYERMRAEALKARAKVPPAAPKKRRQ